MKILLSDAEFNNYKTYDKIPLECKKCGGVFYVIKKEVLLGQKRSEQSYLYCSIKCRTDDTTKLKKFNCAVCGKEILRNDHDIRKNIHGNFFCSKTCAATLNNSLVHKRQKIEKLPKSRKPRERKTTCSKCDVLLTGDNCYKQKKSNGNYTSYPTCKKCHSEFVVERWIQLKKDVVESMGGQCADCKGVFSYEVYDLHHLDPSQKEYNWSKIKKINEEKRQLELKKCVLLCANCHAQRHLLCEVNIRPKPTYKNLSGQQRKCIYCGGDFTINNASTRENGNFKSVCRDCDKKLVLFRQQLIKKEIVIYMGDKCFDCKHQFEYRIYDLHHIDPSTKEYNISSNRKLNIESNKQELKKCVLLCQNCHRLRHREMHKAEDGVGIEPTREIKLSKD